MPVTHILFHALLQIQSALAALVPRLQVRFRTTVRPRLWEAVSSGDPPQPVEMGNSSLDHCPWERQLLSRIFVSSHEDWLEINVTGKANRKVVGVSSGGFGPLRRFVSVAIAVWAKLSDHNISILSAAVAFYSFLSIFPAIAALVSLYGFVAAPTTSRDSSMRSRSSCRARRPRSFQND